MEAFLRMVNGGSAFGLKEKPDAERIKHVFNRDCNQIVELYPNPKDFYNEFSKNNAYIDQLVLCWIAAF